MSGGFVGQFSTGEPGMVEKLDRNDRKILFELGKNARYSLTHIAKVTGLSREVVGYRLKRLERTGFISGYASLIDITRLGWTKHHIYLQLKDYTATDEQQLIQKLVANPRIVWVSLVSGNWDIGLLTASRSASEFYALLNDIILLVGDHLADYIIHTGVDERFLGIKILFDGETPPARTVKLKPDGVAFEKDFKEADGGTGAPLDELDRRILSELATDARIELLALARKLGVTPETAKSRIQRLVRAKIIAGFMPMGSPWLMGYQWHMTHFRLKNLDRASEAGLLTYLEQHPNILWWYKMVGKWTLQASIFTKDSRQFRKVINDLRTRFPTLISDHEAILVHAQLKYLHFIA